MNLRGKRAKLLRGDYFWYISAFLVILVIISFMVEASLLGKLPDENEWHSVIVAIRNFILMGIVGISSWRFGFKGVLAACLTVGLIMLPHVLNETIIEGYHPEVLTEYAVIVPMGLVISVLVGALRQAGTKLKDSEKRYRRLFETAQDAILILNGDSGKIIDANPFVKDLLGYTHEELIGKNLWEIGEIKDIPAGRLSYQELYDSGYKRWANLPLVTRDGRQISVEVVANAYQVDHTRIIQCNIRDMTVANLATEALKTLYDDLKVAQRLTIIGNWKWIIAINKVTWSDELCRINGWDTEAPVPPFAEMGSFYAPESWKRLNEAVAKALNTGEPYELELTQIRTDGTRITTCSRGEADFDANGKIVGLHGTVQDISERKNAEEALQKSETNFKRTMDNLMEGCMIIGFDWTYVYVNDTAARHGQTKSENIIGKTMLEMYPGVEKTAIFANYQRCMEERISMRFEESFTFADGNVVWYSLSVEPVPEGIFVLSLDITERKKAETTISFQSQILQNMSEGVQVTRVIDQVIVFTNPSFERIFGYGPGELLGKHVSVLNATADEQSAQSVAREIIRALEEKGTWQGDVRNIRKDGSTLWCQANVAAFEHNVYGRVWIAVHQDVTQHRKDEEELLRLRQAVEASGEAIFLTDREGVITYINPEFTKLYGYSVAEVVGNATPRILKSGKTTPEEYAAFWNAITDKRVVMGELSNKTKDGRLITIDGSANPILNVQGDIIGFLAIQSDITERKKAEENIRRQSSVLSAINMVLVATLTCETDFEVAIMCLKMAQEMTDSKFGWIGELNQAGRLDIIALSDQAWEECNIPRLEALKSLRNMEVRGIHGRVLRTGESLIANDPSSHSEWGGTPKGHPYMTSFLGIPLKYAGKPIGMIALGNKEAGYNLDDQKSMEALALVFVVAFKRKQANELLQRSEKNLKEAQNLGQIGSWDFDVQKQTLTWSEETYTLFERDPKLGTPSLDEEARYYSPEQTAILRDYASKAIETGQTFSYEFELTLPSGKRVYYHSVMQPVKDAQGQVVRLSGTVQNITERKKVEETLKLQAELLDAELDSVYLHDFEGNLIYVNRAAYLTHGYTREELLNMKLSQLDDPESARLIAPRLREISEKGQLSFEAYHRHKNGSLIPLEVHTSLIEVGSKKLIMSVARDITERNKLQVQLMSQDRLASIGQLVAGVAHEINNPLTGVIGFSELLLNRKNLPEDVMEDIKVVNGEAMRTSRIVRNLLTFARAQPEGKTPVEINEQVQGVLSLREHEERVNNIQVITRFASDLPEVMGNASQLQQVFFNIVINAEFFMIEAHKKGNLTITTERAGKMVRVSIADDGPGISPEHMNHLFTPFFTTKEVGKGTGLGLSICHGIINEHGGRIYAESELGKGSKFVVELPFKEETPA